MKDFTKFTFIKPDGDGNTNYLEEIEDHQCDLCLEWVVQNYYIVRSFKQHTKTKRTICSECEDNIY